MSSPQADWKRQRDELFHGPLEELPEVVHRRRLALVESAVGRGALLDIGCGHGKFLEMAQQHGWQVAGIETAADDYTFSPLVAEKVSSLFMEGLWPAGNFDAVTIWRVLELSRNPIDLMRLAAHYCRVDGVLVVQMRNSEDSGRRQDWSSDSRMLFADCLYSPQALHRFLGRFGFRIETIQQGPLPQREEMLSYSHARGRDYSPALLTSTKSVLPHHREADHSADLLTVTARYIP